MVQTLRHRDVLQTGNQIHLARATLTTARPKMLHDHDFYELFWVQNGTVKHHLPDRSEILSEGAVGFVSPGQHHALQGRGEYALVVSISIHPKTIKSLAKRHPSLDGHLFWSKTPYTLHQRDIRQLAALNHAAVQLERSTCDTLAAEAFLLPLCAELTANILSAKSPPIAASRTCRIFTNCSGRSTV